MCRFAGALEAGGVLGSGAGQIRPHHLLCCSSLEGKVRSLHVARDVYQRAHTTCHQSRPEVPEARPAAALHHIRAFSRKALFAARARMVTGGTLECRWPAAHVRDTARVRSLQVPIVRQLEPELHIDALPSTVEELRRFLPRLLLTREPGAAQGSAGTHPNVTTLPSLSAFFGI
jgi:hypothetical protein